MIDFEFEGGCTLHVEGRFYMFKAVDNVYCLGLYSDPSTVIGNNIIQSQTVVFDLDNKQLGIAPSNISFDLISLYVIFIIVFRK